MSWCALKMIWILSISILHELKVYGNYLMYYIKNNMHFQINEAYTISWKGPGLALTDCRQQGVTVKSVFQVNWLFNAVIMWKLHATCLYRGWVDTSVGWSSKLLQNCALGKIPFKLQGRRVVNAQQHCKLDMLQTISCSWGGEVSVAHNSLPKCLTEVLAQAKRYCNASCALVWDVSTSQVDWHITG